MRAGSRLERDSQRRRQRRCHHNHVRCLCCQTYFEISDQVSDDSPPSSRTVYLPPQQKPCAPTLLSWYLLLNSAMISFTSLNVCTTGTSISVPSWDHGHYDKSCTKAFLSRMHWYRTRPLSSRSQTFRLHVVRHMTAPCPAMGTVIQHKISECFQYKGQAACKMLVYRGAAQEKGIWNTGHTLSVGNWPMNSGILDLSEGRDFPW